MPKLATPLTDIKIKNAKPKDKTYKLSDGKGLYLLVTNKGFKWWRLDYIFENKRQTLSIGTYPTVSLENARKEALRLKEQIKQGINPLDIRKENKETINKKKQDEIINDNSQLHLVVNGWLETYATRVSPVTLQKETNRIANHILKPFSQYNKEGFIISSKPIGKITRAELSNILTNISNEKAETADRLFSHCKGIWLYAISKGYTDRNIIADIDKRNTLAKVDNTHRPKITDEAILRDLLTAIDNYPHNIIIRQLLKLVCHIPLRAENISSLKWQHINLETKMLTIARNEMKVKNKNLPDYKLPLTTQAIEILQETKSLFNHHLWVFPSFNKQNQHINKESPNKALKIMGFDDNGKKQTLHSFRGTFRSIAESYKHIHKADKETMEAVLDHIEPNKSTLAYTHLADYTAQMLPLLQWWSDYLETIKHQATS